MCSKVSNKIYCLAPMGNQQDLDQQPMGSGTSKSVIGCNCYFICVTWEIFYQNFNWAKGTACQIVSLRIARSSVFVVLKRLPLRTSSILFYF